MVAMVSMMAMAESRREEWKDGRKNKRMNGGGDVALVVKMMIVTAATDFTLQFGSRIARGVGRDNFLVLYNFVHLRGNGRNQD